MTRSIKQYVDLIVGLETAAEILDNIREEYYADVCSEAADAIEDFCDMLETSMTN